MTNEKAIDNSKKFYDQELNKLEHSIYGFQIVINDHKGNKTFYMCLNETLIERIEKILM